MAEIVVTLSHQPWCVVSAKHRYCVQLCWILPAFWIEMRKNVLILILVSQSDNTEDLQMAVNKIIVFCPVIILYIYIIYSSAATVGKFHLLIMKGTWKK